jgi:predicted CXXCH cytochrome family protein
MQHIKTLKNKILAAVIVLIFFSLSITSAGAVVGSPQSAGTVVGSHHPAATIEGPPHSAGTIVGSPHDFRGYLWNRSGEICNPCHAMHGTKTLPAPLWNSELSTQTYIMYGQTYSPTMHTAVSSQPDGMSKICLSCHDGIIAPDAYGGNMGGTATLFGKDLLGPVPSNNHPISFIYNTALASKDGDLYDPSTRLSGMTGSARTINKDMLFSNKMECASCHDVHNIKAVPGTKLLVKDPAGSALCLTCHNK